MGAIEHIDIPYDLRLMCLITGLRHKGGMPVFGPLKVNTLPHHCHRLTGYSRLMNKAASGVSVTRRCGVTRVRADRCAPGDR